MDGFFFGNFLKFGDNGKLATHFIPIFAEISVVAELQEIWGFVGGVGRQVFCAFFFYLATTGNFVNILFAIAPKFPNLPKFRRLVEEKRGAGRQFFFPQLVREVWRKREI